MRQAQGADLQPLRATTVATAFDGRDRVVMLPDMLEIGKIAAAESSIAHVIDKQQATKPGGNTHLVPLADPPIPLPRPGTQSLRQDGFAILLVEDQPEVCDILAEILKEAGYFVTTASSGTQALTRIEAGTVFDALITDVGLPDKNGIEVAAAARRRWPRLPVIIITGYVDDDSPGTEHRVLVKPFGAEALLHALSEALGRQRAGLGMS
jgi:CheY-like chemotaxis protein